MFSLMDRHTSCFLFEQIFLEKIPDDIRLTFADNEFTHPHLLAARADVLWQIMQQNETSITNTTAVTTSTRLNGTTLKLLANIHEK